MSSLRDLEESTRRWVGASTKLSSAAFILFVGGLGLLAVSRHLLSEDGMKLAITIVLLSAAAHLIALVAHTLTYVAVLLGRLSPSCLKLPEKTARRLLFNALMALISLTLIVASVPTLPYVIIAPWHWGYLIGMSIGLHFAIRFYRETEAELADFGAASTTSSSLSA